MSNTLRNNVEQTSELCQIEVDIVPNFTKRSPLYIASPKLTLSHHSLNDIFVIDLSTKEILLYETNVWTNRWYIHTARRLLLA